MVKVLSCKCGDCLHWEIAEVPAPPVPVGLERLGPAPAPDQFLKCKTCGAKYEIEITVPAHDQVEWVERSAL
jgi:hypothetical protein